MTSQRPRPARSEPEVKRRSTPVREVNGVRKIGGGWSYTTVDLDPDEEVITDAIAMGRPNWPRGMAYLTDLRIIFIPQRFSLFERPTDAYLATLRRLSIFRKFAWGFLLSQWFRPVRWYRFETASDDLTIVTPDADFYEAVRNLARQKAWHIDDKTA